jgi:hypothetical protein
MLLTIQLTALGYLVWKMSWHMDDIATGKHILHALAAGYVQSFFFDYLLELMGAPT